MRTSWSLRSAVSTLALAGIVSSASAQLCRPELLVNGSFEFPVVPANTALPIAPDNWSWQSAVGFVFRGSPAPIWPLAQSGQQYADIGNDTQYRLRQNFTVPHRARMSFTWYDSAASGFVSAYDVFIYNNATEEYPFYYDFGFVNSSTWKFVDANGGQPFLLEAGSYRVEFVGNAIPNDYADTLIDNVSLSFDRGPDANRLGGTRSLGGGERYTLDAFVSGEGPITHQWQIETAPGTFTNLTENLMTPVGAVVGVFTDKLTIERAINGGAAKFRLLLNNVCRSSVSEVTTIEVSRCNTIDINRNGVFPEDQDVIDFFTILAGGECSTGDCVNIDFNGNGVFPEDQDVIDYFAVLAGSSCPG
ncbi:MAG TPA: hypothetical protein VK157_10355 [Phycisphaerales bacterium]|nr:hypothetical protein [Phycisphaerales bacterium]